MKTLQKVGGIAALICAGTFILAMGLVATLLTPMLDSSLPYDQFMAFYLPHRSLVFLWHFSMYLVNGTFLTLLVLALYQQFKTSAPALSLVAARFGLFWTGLIIASGFISPPAGKQSTCSRPLTLPRPKRSGWWCTTLPPASTPRPLPGLSVGAAHQLGRPAHGDCQAVELPWALSSVLRASSVRLLRRSHELGIYAFGVGVRSSGGSGWGLCCCAAILARQPRNRMSSRANVANHKEEVTWPQKVLGGKSLIPLLHLESH